MRGALKRRLLEEVEDAADAWEELARILHTGLALEERLDEVTDYGRDAQNHAQYDCVERRHPGQAIAQPRGQAQRARCRNHQRAGESLPGFTRADARDHFVAANERARAVGPHVAKLGHHEQAF